MANKPHTGRKLVDIAQKARGRTPLKYELEVIPFFAGELPSGLEKVSFVWERGSKVFHTDAEAVNPHTKAVFWKQYLRQTATLYKDNGHLLPKEYSFKIQHVRGSGESSSRKTIGKIKVDMSQFCSEETTPIPQEVFLQLKPAGKVKLSVKASWLKHAKVDLEALTEASFTTHKSNELGLEAEGDEEQDLSGFDPVHLDSEGTTPKQQQHSRSPSNGTKPTAGIGSSSAVAAKQRAASNEGSSQASGSPRIPAVGTTRKSGANIAGAIDAFSVGLSPDEAAEQEKARLAAIREAELEKMRRTVEDQLRFDLKKLNDTFAQRNKTSCWDILCCCFPKKSARVRFVEIMDDNERVSLAQGAYL